MDNETGFRALLEAKQLDNGLFQAVLTMTVGQDDPEPLVVPLAGMHESAEEAKTAARLAIAAMAKGG